eukprot:15447735-Alexandrium_andersonii.AAC.1
MVRAAVHPHAARQVGFDDGDGGAVVVNTSYEVLAALDLVHGWSYEVFRLRDPDIFVGHFVPGHKLTVGARPALDAAVFWEGSAAEKKKRRRGGGG